MKRAVAAAVLLVLLLGAAAAALLSDRFGGFPTPVFVQIPLGSSTRQVAALLAARGVVRSKWQFIAVRALRPKTVLQAGEYRFAQPDTPWGVFQRLAAGDVFYHRLTVPEGANIFDIDAALHQLGLSESGAFVAAARDPRLVGDLLHDLAPGAPSLEGYLFPSTYHLTRGTTTRDIARDMVAQFRRVWQELGDASTPHDVVTLASLVEKESAVLAERPLVASVYRNRLDKGMKLDCDPTTIYAAHLDGRWRGVIYRSDLDNPHPYNTYRHAGLPPGPIANPGRESLLAALQPAPTGYYYFVAKPDGSGGHVFSASVAAHQQAVALYRRGTQKALRTGPAPRRTAKPKPARRH